MRSTGCCPFIMHDQRDGYVRQVPFKVAVGWSPTGVRRGEDGMRAAEAP